MVIQGRQTPYVTKTLFQFCDHQIFLPLPWPVNDQYWNRTPLRRVRPAHSHAPTSTVEHTQVSHRGYAWKKQGVCRRKRQELRSEENWRTSEGSVIEGRNTILKTKQKTMVIIGNCKSMLWDWNSQATSGVRMVEMTLDAGAGVSPQKNNLRLCGFLCFMPTG